MGAGELIGLVDELEELCAAKPSSEGAFERLIEIERRLIELLSQDHPAAEQRRAVRVPCELEVTVRRDGDVSPGVVTDFGHGGIYVATALRAGVGEQLEIEARTLQGAPVATFSVRGEVVWAGEKSGNPGYGVNLEPPDEDTQQNLWRLLIGLLRQGQT